jgi:hypothetical protein
MAGAEIGGDSSVEWDVQADHVRGTPAHGANGQGRWRQHGTDETGVGAQSGFFFVLEMPQAQQDRDTFVDTLCQACTDAKANRGAAGYLIRFTLPIEQGNPNQIAINWISTPLQPGRRVAAAKAVARKSGLPARSRKKAGKRSPKKQRR